MTSTEEYRTVRFERDGAIGWVRLNRPDKLNAFNMTMWRELRALGRDLVADPDLRVVVVIGEGRAFSSGIDTSVFTGGAEGDDGAGLDDLASLDEEGEARHSNPVVANILRAQESYSWLAEAPYPTIAAVRGYALGAGLQLALACDLRVFARGTQTGLLEHRYGIMPDLGGTQRLPRVVGAGKAKELIWTVARIDADEAYRIGLCERLVEDEALEAEVTGLAALLASQPPLAVRNTKAAIEAAGRLPVAQGLVVEAENQAECLRSADMGEAIAAFVEGRPAAFRGE